MTLQNAIYEIGLLWQTGLLRGVWVWRLLERNDIICVVVVIIEVHLIIKCVIDWHVKSAHKWWLGIICTFVPSHLERVLNKILWRLFKIQADWILFVNKTLVDPSRSFFTSWNNFIVWHKVCMNKMLIHLIDLSIVVYLLVDKKLTFIFKRWWNRVVYQVHLKQNVFKASLRHVYKVFGCMWGHQRELWEIQVMFKIYNILERLLYFRHLVRMMRDFTSCQTFLVDVWKFLKKLQWRECCI